MERGKIDIPEEYVAKIEKYVQEGRFSDLNDFFVQAIKLMLMAEDNKGNFQNIIKEE